MLENKHLKLEQSNNLVYSSYNMTLSEKRLLCLSISVIVKEMKRFPVFKVKSSELKDFLDLKGQSFYTHIKETCRKLLKRTVEIEDEKTHKWTGFQWVSRCTVDPTGGTIEIKINDELKPHLLELKRHYQSIPFDHIARIGRFPAIRLFEIFWHKKNEKGTPLKTITIGLDELKTYLGMNGKYSVFSSFKNRVLEPSKKDLKENTPLKFTYKPLRIKKRVVSIEFNVTRNENYISQKLPKFNTEMLLELKEESDNNERKRIIWKHVCKHMNHGSIEAEYKKLTEMGKTLEEIEEAAKWAAEEIDRRSKTTDPINNPPAFVRWAMRGGKEDRDNMRRRKRLTR